MEMINVLHMNGGIGDTSYANNSQLQNFSLSCLEEFPEQVSRVAQKISKVLVLVLQKMTVSMASPIIEEAISKYYYSSSSSFREGLCIADVGCSSGRNTLDAVLEIIKNVDKIFKQEGLGSPEFQVYLNDLPGNDFNSVFRALPRFQEELKEQIGPDFGPCFFTGVPGSFYQRLFLSGSLHFVVSFSALHWLSQVPKLEETNKGNISVARTSPPSVLKAYQEQFHTDYTAFLKCRSEELVIEGRMVLTFLVRESDDHFAEECCYIWEIVSMALRDMVSQGVIEENKMDGFNVPFYIPSTREVKKAVEEEGSFSIDRLQVSELNWNVTALVAAKAMRAVAEPLLVNHFGQNIIDMIFQRYQEIFAEKFPTEVTQISKVIVSLIKNVV